MDTDAVLLCVCCDDSLGNWVDTGLHHRQAFTTLDIVWELLDTCVSEREKEKEKEKEREA